MSENNHNVTSGELHAEIEALEERLKKHTEEQVERLETKLLTAFHGWARSMEIRVRTGEATTSGVGERVALLEERVRRLEQGER